MQDIYRILNYYDKTVVAWASTKELAKVVAQALRNEYRDIQFVVVEVEVA